MIVEDVSAICPKCKSIDIKLVTLEMDDIKSESFVIRKEEFYYCTNCRCKFDKSGNEIDLLKFF